VGVQFSALAAGFPLIPMVGFAKLVLDPELTPIAPSDMNEGFAGRLAIPAATMVCELFRIGLQRAVVELAGKAMSYYTAPSLWVPRLP
jgi:hypothetical protein